MKRKSVKQLSKISLKTLCCPITNFRSFVCCYSKLVGFYLLNLVLNPYNFSYRLTEMRKLTLIFIFLFGFNLYSQDIEYKAISESDISAKHEKVIDTLNNKLLSWKWKVMKPDDKKKIRNRILKLKKDIESDSANVTKIYYFGKKANVGLKINGMLSKPPSSLIEYYSESIFGDSIFKIDLGTIPRYSKVESATVFFNDLKRIAEIEIDTNYSLIHIEVEHIENLTEILRRKKEFDENRKKLKESGKEPEIPDTIEVLNDEVVLINHKIPKRKYY